MNFRKLLIHWSKLSAALVLLVAIHGALHIEGAEPLARATLPTMSHSQAEAEQQLQSMLAKHEVLSWSDLSTSDKISCLGLYEGAQSNCLEQKLQMLKLRPPTITDAYEALKNIYEYQVFKPRVKRIRDYALPWGFGMLYALIALSALWSLWQWVRSSGVTTLGRVFDKLPFLSQLKPSKISQTTKGLLADRLYRNAASEFMNLETLHKNGLISDEVFHTRKSELAAKLDPHRNSHTGRDDFS